MAAIIDRSLQRIFSGFVFGIGSGIGAPLGAFLLPLGGWTLLRRVSFGRLILGTVLGTLVGGLAGWFITMDTNAIFRSIVGGVVGFVGAAMFMRWGGRAPQ